jgi:hypothetical protein
MSYDTARVTMPVFMGITEFFSAPFAAVARDVVVGAQNRRLLPKGWKPDQPPPAQLSQPRPYWA